MTTSKQSTDPKFGEEGDNAAITAFWICGIRATEHKRGDAALIKDPYAERLMNEWAWTQQRSLFRLRKATINRTLHYDSNILRGAREYGCRQMIMIGAGLDTRAFRLFHDFPDMHVIEVDHPNMFAYKEPRLKDVKPVCKRSIVALNYDEVTEWDVRAKEKHGFDPSKPTIFVLEGVTMYIKPKDEVDLYKKIDQNAAINSMITGCNLKLLRTRGKPKDLGNGIIWYDTDRRAIKEVLQNWGLRFKSLHWFDPIGIYVMVCGVKRPEGEYSQKTSLNIAIYVGVVAIVLSALYSLVS